MGALRYNYTNAEENNTKRDIHCLTGYDSRPCMTGKFPQKGHIRVSRYNGIKRDSGRLKWVRMGVGGCIGTQQTQNKSIRDTDMTFGRNFGKGMCGGN